MATNYIKYNSNQLIYPTPLVELSRENTYDNNHLGFVDKITLKGQLTGNFYQLQTGQSGILNIFNQNFGSFEIYEETSQGSTVFDKIYEKSGINITSISFEESAYNGMLNYTITLNSSTMTGNVINPVNQYNFTENKDKTISLSRSLSAQGINTAKYPSKSNALENAITFVTQNTGLATMPTIKFISGDRGNFYLQNISESIDRLNAIYSVDESYTSSLLNTESSGILKYSIDISSGVAADLLRLSIKGSYKGSLGGNINNLRDSLNVTKLVSGAYSSYFNPIPINYSVSENTGENIINFDYSFDNINLPNPYFKYETSIEKDDIEQSIKVDLNASIIARGNKKNRYLLSTSNQASLNASLFALASGAVSDFKDFTSDTGSYKLRLQNMEFIDNPNEGVITAKATYDDKPMPSGDDPAIADSSFQISVQAPCWYMVGVPAINQRGYYTINDFNITTLPKCTIESTVSIKDGTSQGSTTAIQNNIKNSMGIISPVDYNFNITIRESFSEEKANLDKVSNLTQPILNTKNVNYKIEKVCTNNQSSIFPRIS